ncbi:MAG: hypothetical protein ACK443_02475 [Methylococcaceae bacterium]|jgi:hypothetical protein
MKQAVFCVLSLICLSQQLAQAETFSDDFTSYITGPSGISCCQTDGSAVGGWTLVFGGYGQACIVKTSPTDAWLNLTPKPPVAANETHATLVSGRIFKQPYTYSVAVRTERQLRLNGKPNTWEVGWVIWDYVPVGSSSKFYYFSLKPNGWEFGQFNTGIQRFLRTGSSPVLSMNQWYTFTVTQTGNDRSCRSGALHKLWITSGATTYPLTSFCDSRKPITSGKIGFYTEDASADYTKVIVTTP